MVAESWGCNNWMVLHLPSIAHPRCSWCGYGKNVKDTSARVINQNHQASLYSLPVTHSANVNVKDSHTHFIISSDIFHNLLFHLLGAEIKVAVADPLDFKPVPEVIVSTTLELHLQLINVLLLEAAPWCVCVLVEADAVSQASLQRRLQTSLHCIAHDDSEQHEDGEETRDCKVGLQEVLPARKSPDIQGILTDLCRKVVDTQGGQANNHKGIGHNVYICVIHYL